MDHSGPDAEGAAAAPAISRDQVLVAAGQDAAESLARIADLGVGAEVQTFARPGAPGQGEPLDGAISALIPLLAGVRGPIGYHGPFIDTVHYSQDADVQAIARQRYAAALDAAARLGAGFVIFHSQYNPLIRVRHYPRLYHERSLEFWPRLVAHAESLSITIYLENMFEDSPEPLLRLVEAVDSPRLRICGDIAHMALFSSTPPREWVRAWGPRLGHVHLNDTLGAYDDHLPLGEGNLDIQAFLQACAELPHPLTYTLENSTLSGAEASLAYLRLR